MSTPIEAAAGITWQPASNSPTPWIVKVKFNDQTEFCEELRARRGQMRVPILRSTQRFVQSPDMPTLQELTVCASFLFDIGGILNIATLERYVGQIGYDPTHTRRTLAEAKRLIDLLIATGEDLQLRCAPGQFNV